MSHTLKTRFLALLLAVLMVVGMIPMTVLAEEAEQETATEETQTVTETSEEEPVAQADAGEVNTDTPVIAYEEAADDYYKVITKDDYILAPGIAESQIVLNNASSTHRQVAHVVEVNLNNPYTKVIPSYKGMIPQAGKYGVQIMSQQAAWAEANGYGNVVAAMNLSLSWYDSAYYAQHPELVGEPLGYMILDGVQYTNSNGPTSGAQTCVVINFDEKDGVARPADMPKVVIRSTSDPITGWEEQVIPANFGFLVKDGKNQYGVDNNANNGASRSFVGVKADGTFVMVMNDGRQSPYSAGFTNYEMAEFMLSLGCVHAVNGDGGGSSAFLSQRPGEELKINCSPSDGAERPTTHGILVISTAPATGEFVRAQISTPADYYTPGSTVKFTALGTDLVGTSAEIPADVSWQLADPAMGTIEDGVFVSNGKTGTVTAQLIYKGAVVGEGSVEIVIPTEFAFAQSIMTVPFDKEVTIGMIATINGGLHNVELKDSDITFTTTNEALGTFNGLKFTSVAVENAPEDLTSTLTATLNHGENLVATAKLNLGKGSEILFDFEEASDLDAWKMGVVNGYHESGFYAAISHATEENGEVHNGTGSLRIETNGLSAVDVSAGGYAQVAAYLNDGVIVKNAKSIGFWAYIPDEYEHCWIRVLYWYDSNNDGTYDKKNTITVINQPEVYNTWDESGWKYFSVDVSAYESILIPGINDPDSLFPAANHPNKGQAKEPNDYRFIEFMFPHTNTNDLWKNHGTINGPFTIYIDNITADYSDAVDDREEPIFTGVTLNANDTETKLEKYNTVTTASNVINVTATVKENTTKTNATGLNAASAKAYVDGVAVACTYANGRIMINDIALADGVHRVKFEIADNMGNKSVVIRLIKVASGVDASTIRVVPKDSTLDRLYYGSLYWMNVNATDIETIQTVTAVIDLNSVNHWELDHMEVAEGFTASYTLNAETNTAAITITRTGVNDQTGEATLASLPIRIVSFDTDMKIAGYTAETFWKSYDFWPQDLKVDVDMGQITYVDGYTAGVLNVFSNEEFSVDTETYTSSANMDAAFKAERGTAHVHTPEAVEDVPATCTTAGITGKTYCDVCDSVVDWGTVVPAKGHSFTVEADGLYTCADCGELFYYVGGEMQTGWQKIDDKDYYFNANGAAVDGEATIDGHTYTFTEHVLTDGAWEKLGEGYTVCWWAGKKLEDCWVTMNGKTYHFTGDMMNVGIQKMPVLSSAGIYTGYKYYVFGDDGVWMVDHVGFYSDGVNACYAEDGVAVYKGVCQDAEGNYYYMNSKFLAVKSCTYTIGAGKTNGLIPAGTYEFDEKGRMINPPSVEEPTEPTEPEVTEPEVTEPEATEPKPDVKNGLVKDSDGEIRYYENGVAVYKGLVKDEDGNFYYINSAKKAVKNCSYTIGKTRANGLLDAGTYEFGADGKMLNPPADEPEEPTTPTEPEATEPKPTEPEATEPKPTEPSVKSGLVKDSDGEIRYYENGVAVYKGLVKDEDGNFYYINSSKKAVKNCSYTIGKTKANGLVDAGTYQFGADGEMLNPPVTEDPDPTDPTDPEPTEPEATEPKPDVKNGLVKDSDGEIRYYENGVAIYAGLVKDEDGNLYYINSAKKAVKNCTYTIGKTRANGLAAAGTYQFDAEGKMVR